MNAPGEFNKFNPNKKHHGSNNGNRKDREESGNGTGQKQPHGDFNQTLDNVCASGSCAEIILSGQTSGPMT